MTEVHANARARVFRFDESDDDMMAPLPPPPRPQTRPVVARGIPVATASRATAHKQRAHDRRLSNGAAGAVSEDDVGAPQTPPVPHAHPLAALARSNNSHATHRYQASLRQPLRGKRLNPAFFNPERINAFLRNETQAGSGNAAVGANRSHSANGASAPHTSIKPPHDPAAPSLSETRVLHSSRALERRMREIEATPALIPELLEDERVRAATDASHWRPELHPLPLHTTLVPSANGALVPAEDSALERARVRKVGKQVDPKWLERQRDAANRPRAPLDRPDELHLREQLFQTSSSELLASGVLFDDDDAARLLSFDDSLQPTRALPIVSNGTTGLPGCCFDTWTL